MSSRLLRNYILYNKYVLLKKQNFIYFYSGINQNVSNLFWIRSFFLKKIFNFTYFGVPKYSFSLHQNSFFSFKNNALYNQERDVLFSNFILFSFCYLFYFFRFFYFFRLFKC